MKKHLIFLFALLLSFFSLESFAITEGTPPTAVTYTTITDGVDFSKLTTALGTVFASMATVGIFLKGGGLILRKLGWK